MGWKRNGCISKTSAQVWTSSGSRRTGAFQAVNHKEPFAFLTFALVAGGFWNHHPPSHNGRGHVVSLKAEWLHPQKLLCFPMMIVEPESKYKSERSARHQPVVGPVRDGLQGPDCKHNDGGPGQDGRVRGHSVEWSGTQQPSTPKKSIAQRSLFLPKKFDRQFGVLLHNVSGSEVPSSQYDLFI